MGAAVFIRASMTPMRAAVDYYVCVGVLLDRV